MKPACNFCGGPDNARMVRQPYGTVCLPCAAYIDRRGPAFADMIPRPLRRGVVDTFTWGALRYQMEHAEYADDGTDPFEGVS